MNAVIAGACEQAERLGGRAYGIRGGFGGLADAPSGARSPPRTRARTRDESGTWLGTSRWTALATPDGLARVPARARRPRPHRAAGDRRQRLRAWERGCSRTASPSRSSPRRSTATSTDRRRRSAWTPRSATPSPSIDQLRVTARSLPGRAFLVQTLGAPHGFLADAVAAAAGIDHVLVPEREIDLDAVAVGAEGPRSERLRDRGHVRGRRRRGAHRRGARRALRGPRPPHDPRPRAARGRPVGARSGDRPGGGPRRRGRARERTLRPSSASATTGP